MTAYHSAPPSAALPYARLFAGLLLPLGLIQLPAHAEFSPPAEAFQGMPVSDALANLPLAIETFSILLSRPASIFDARNATACKLSPADARLAVLGPTIITALEEEARKGGMATETVSGQLDILSGPCPTTGKLTGMTEYIWDSETRLDFADLVSTVKSRQRGIAQYDAQGNPARTLSVIEASHTKLFQRQPSGELRATAQPGQTAGQATYSITYGRGYMGQADDLQVTFTLIDTPPSLVPSIPPLRSAVAIIRYLPDGEVIEQYSNNRLQSRTHLNSQQQMHGWLEFFDETNHATPPVRQCFQQGAPAPEAACAKP